MKRTLTRLLPAFALIALGTGKLQAQTTVPSLITSNQVWDKSGSPYLINQNTFIDSGITVTIMPGVDVLSSSTSNSLLVEGELQALGTDDSTITVDKLQIQFLKDAKSYDSSNGSGALLRHCSFTSTGIGKQVISINGQSVRIENCIFWHTYYSVYSMSGISNRIEVLNCIFEDSTGMSYPIYATGSNTEMVILGNTFNNVYKGGGMIIYGKMIYFMNNHVNGPNSVEFTGKGATISCNMFKHVRSGVTMNINTQDSTSDFVFTHNTLDSMGYSMIKDPMLTINRGASIYRLNQSRFNNNNFLTYVGGFPFTKVAITGGNPTPTSSESVDLKNNYWVSTDSATIDTLINDYADNIMTFGRADFSGFLSSLDTSCSDSVGSSCAASFYIAIDTGSPYNVFIINNSTGTTGSTSYYWDFGDGTGSNDATPTHTYSEFQKYRLCLTIFNALENCYSTFCDSVGVDSNGTLLKNGFTIRVLNESDLNSVKAPQAFGEVRIYPNPTGGNLILELKDARNEPIGIRVLDLTGKVVHQTKPEVSGSGIYAIDLSSLEPGIYLMNVQEGRENFTTKIIIAR